MLRRPTNRPDEKRTDPLYEFGSFGCTGCHSATLMHPRNVDALKGSRLAFVQGGDRGLRLVHLTGPVKPTAFEDRVEARWTPADMPFRYAHAPVVVCNAQQSDLPAIEALAATARRPTKVAGFSSLFRSRKRALEEPYATELVRLYEALRAAAEPSAIATTYVDALPYEPPLVDTDRRATYEKLRRRLDGRPTLRSPNTRDACR